MRLLEALARRPLQRPPIWLMRQAGRYLPEYRELRSRYSFEEAVRTPEVAAEITLQPIRRFGMDAAVIFADIMTPLEGMGVQVRFDPGPKLAAHTAAQVAGLPELRLPAVDFVAGTIARVREALPPEVAVIGFAGAPVTLLAYLLEGGGSRDFLSLRSTVWTDPDTTAAALQTLAEAMSSYLRMQVEAGADVVQLFDTWAGLLPRSLVERLAVPAARTALDGLGVPTIYFAPGASHALDLLTGVGATGYGVDWRVPLDEAWRRIGTGVALQGNLDPSVLLTDAATVRRAAQEVLERAGGRPGHIFNLGHGVDKDTPPEHVQVLVETVKGER